MKCKTFFTPSQDDPGLDCSQQPSITEQHHKDRVDINNIMNRYTQTGLLPDTRPELGVYGDFSSVGDYLESQLKIKEAEHAFMQLDARVRKRFQNNPAHLIEFLQDPSNKDEAIKLGLLAISKPITPVKDSPTATESSKT